MKVSNLFMALSAAAVLVSCTSKPGDVTKITGVVNDPEVAELMHRFCGKRVLKLEGYDFDGFLDWANKSMRAVSQSSPGEKVKGQALPASITIDDLM